MHRPERVEEGSATAARELFERVGYARCELDRVEREVAELVARRQSLATQSASLQKQNIAVLAENEALEAELLQRLARWQVLDDVNCRVENILPQLRAVTGSLCYRAAVKALAVVNRIWRAVLPGKPPAN